MAYDCSITKRHGCNYCCKCKKISSNNDNVNLYINDSLSQLQIESNNSENISNVNIFYCPICGKKLE